MSAEEESLKTNLFVQAFTEKLIEEQLTLKESLEIAQMLTIKLVLLTESEDDEVQEYLSTFYGNYIFNKERERKKERESEESKDAPNL
jgi:hypothetical protein